MERRLLTLIRRTVGDTRTDADLLAVIPDDNAAFAELVARHGPMVWRVCRHLLGEADAEDAFQATFLALLRSTLRDRAALAAWLHGVAVRVSLAARREAGRRRAREQAAAVHETARPREPDDWEDTMAVVHREVALLPEPDRSAFVLCVLEGLTQAETAARLGRTAGAIAGQVTRAKNRLVARLSRRGVAPGIVALGTAANGGAVPPRLMELVLGLPGAGASPTVLQLMNGALSMSGNTKRIAAVILGVIVATGLWAVVAGPSGPSPEKEPAPEVVRGERPKPEVAPAPPESPIAKALQPFQGVLKMDLCDSELENLGAPQKEVWKWRWTVKNDEILWARQGEEWRLSFTVDPSKTPMEIDLTFLSGPFTGQKSLGVYEWGGIDGKSLNISIQDPGADVPRPKKVVEMRGGGRTSLMFLRPTQSVDPEKELATLQGTWIFDIVQTDSWPKPIGKGPDKTGQGSERQWVIQGNEITWIGFDGKEVKASFTINPQKVPKHIDLTFLSGPNKGEKCMGVYERGGVEDKVLWLCMVDPGSKADRPKDISYATSKGRSMIGLLPFEAPAVKEARLFKGVWKFAVCQSEWWPVNRPTAKDEFPKWRWTVQENEMNWTSVSTGDVKVSFAVDPTKSPKEIDFTFLDGPHKGGKCRGVYKLKGGSLWICLQDPGVKVDRPTDFSAAPSKGHSLLILDPVE